jgi:pimeloyl-ACP methyl ester carboxylesterase
MSAPIPKPPPARTALAWLTHSLMFGFGFIPDRHRPRRARDIRTLVFVHGLAANRAGFLPLQAYLRLTGHRRQLTFNYRSTGSIESIALRLRRHIDANVKGGHIDLIAHSMGGLVARYYVQRLGGARRVDRVLTLGTPHHGTTAATPGGWLPLGLVSQLDPAGAFLRELNDLPAPAGVRFVSFAAEHDGLVRPVESAFAPFGDHVILPGQGHLDMLLAPRVFSRIEKRVRFPARRARSGAPVASGGRNAAPNARVDRS